MNFILNLFLKLAGIVIFLLFIFRLSDFFGIDLTSYLIYFVWFIAILILYSILPKQNNPFI